MEATCVTETWLIGKIHKEEGIRSVFNDRHIYCTDIDTSLVLLQKYGELTKQGYTTLTYNRAHYQLK